MSSAERTIERLESVSQAWWLFSFLARVVIASTTALALLQAAVLLDVVFRLPGSGLWLLLAGWAASVVGLVAWVVASAVRGPRNVDAAARRLEQAAPQLGNDLINVVQLSREAERTRSRFYYAAVGQALRRLAEVRLSPTATCETRWGRFRHGLQTSRDVLECLAAFLVVLAVAYGLTSFVPRWSSATSRLLHPWADVPMVGSVVIREVTPGDAQVVLGSGLEIRVTIDNPRGRRHRASLRLERPNGSKETLAMVSNSDNTVYVAAIPTVLENFRYRVEVGDSESPMFDIKTVARPVIESVSIRYVFPRYLQMKTVTVQQEHGDLEAPQFTTAHVVFRSVTPLSRGYIEINGKQLPGAVGEDGRSLKVRMFLEENASYTVHLFSKAGHTESAPRVNQVRVQPDRPPAVQLIKPAGESSLAVSAPLTVALRAGDDHGLDSVRIEIKPGGESDGGDVRVAKSWDELAGDRQASLSASIPLEFLQLEPGGAVLVRAVAVDGRRFGRNYQPQQTATPWHRVQILAPQQQAAEQFEQLDQLRNRLWDILRIQIEARTALASLSPEHAEALADVPPIQAKQLAVFRLGKELVDSLKPDEDHERDIRTVLNNLVHGAMTEAVRQSKELADVRDPGEWAGATSALKATQDRIIDVLRSLLDEARRATAEKLAEMEERPGGDLPNDVQDKLRELKDKLEEFIQQQKKVIEASKNLAKTPVADFTEKEEQLLKELAAIEDEWSRFLEDFHSDLSKLPQQDFSNPSLLEELVEIQTEIKMAEGALTKKTVDIAVPLEQLGAEMAEEMTTNIEKWLPDTPDRERWSQEEPLTDEMKEAPMAELPGELEDLVGELMEEEEDLFDEMEDASSSWADSLDKGAGWDAADGPISNMSARGVTGNRLPNTSEISGRSGEGRQGKASGEFVGDTAVGKGGRKTPSRLTPDANVQGQIKDFSKDPVGGATGGGKESGQGGEGLEGPIPPQREREMKRLASKQAALRNKAEAIDLRFKVLDYHHTDLKKLIDQMAAVESDLASGKYQSALRRRQVLLEGFKNVKVYLGGELEIRKDATASVPQDVQKEILGSMTESSPRGWEDLNRRYFERLSVGKSSAGAVDREHSQKKGK